MSDPGAGFSHLRADGAVHMIDVGDKPATKRTATARAVFTSTPEVIGMLATGSLPKGEALAVARIAGIMAAKRTSDLVPLCHPLPISSVDVSLECADDRVVVLATVGTTGPTGVEMEALTAASVAALTLYDMVKGTDRAARIESIEVTEKRGGRTGEWVRD